MCFDRENNRQITEYPLYLHEDENGNSEIIGRKGRKVRRLEMGGGMPEGGEPYKQLVTDGEGVAKWEDRLAYATFEYEEIQAEETVVSEEWARDDGSVCYGAYLSGADRLWAGDVCKVIFNGVEYICEARWDAEYRTFNLGNGVLGYSQTDSGGNGEPFLISVSSAERWWELTVASVQECTVQVMRRTSAVYTKIPDAYLPDGASIGRKGTFETSEIFNMPENVASGAYSHAEGWMSTASGYYSHAEGASTTASGNSSHAEGNQTVAKGFYSHAEGFLTNAAYMAQHVQGKCNIPDADGLYAHIVGNGSVDVLSNAHTLDWSGNAWFAGTVEGTGIIIASPNGTRYQIVVADDGTLSATPAT